MSGYRQFMTLVRKEAKALRGALIGIAAVYLILKIYGIIRLFLYPVERYNLRPSTLDAASPVFRTLLYFGAGYQYAVVFLFPVVLILYAMVSEDSARTNLLRDVLPAPRYQSVLAKVLVILGLFVTILAINSVTEPIHSLHWSWYNLGYEPSVGEYFLTLARHASQGVQFVLRHTLFYLSATVFAYTVVHALKRNRIAVGIAVFILVIVAVSALDGILRPYVTGYAEMSQHYHSNGTWHESKVWRSGIRPWYPYVYPLTWIAATLGAGLFIHEKYGEA